MERATGVEPATSSLGTITSRETQGKTETKRAKFLHFPDRREPCSYRDFRQFPADCPEFSLKEIARRLIRPAQSGANGLHSSPREQVLRITTIGA